MIDKVAKAFEVLKEAINEDVTEGSLAHTWHCNIAMMCYDAIDHYEITAFEYESGKMCSKDISKIGNDAASRFMKICFDVKTA